MSQGSNREEHLEALAARRRKRGHRRRRRRGGPAGVSTYQRQASVAAQAERLLWRAGFGPRPGQAAALAKKGLDGAVDSLHAAGAREADRRRAPTTTTAARSRPTTPGATTTCGGSTGWCAPTASWSSGWR